MSLDISPCDEVKRRLPEFDLFIKDHERKPSIQTDYVEVTKIQIRSSDNLLREVMTTG